MRAMGPFSICSGFHNGDFGKLLIVHIADERQIALVAGFLGRNVDVLLHGDRGPEAERGVFSGFHFHPDDSVEARADRSCDRAAAHFSDRRSGNSRCRNRSSDL